MTEDLVARATRVLLASRHGTGALDGLMETLYGELRALASSRLRGDGAARSLDTTELVHEAYLRLVDQRQVDFSDRARFLAASAAAIRRVLVDHARRRLSDKRGGRARRITLSGEMEGPRAAPVELDLLALDDALEALSSLHPRPARVVQMRFFAGMSVEEVALVLHVAPRTVKGDYALGRAWLQKRLAEGRIA